MQTTGGGKRHVLGADVFVTHNDVARSVTKGAAGMFCPLKCVTVAAGVLDDVIGRGQRDVTDENIRGEVA